MSDLTSLLATEQLSRAQRVPELNEIAMLRASRAIRRRRTARAAGSVATGILGLATLTAGLWAALGQRHDASEPIATPSFSSTAILSASAQPSPSSSADPEPSPTATIEAALTKRDGGAPTSNLGDHSWALGQTLPDLLVPQLTSVENVREMQPWVWDHVGAGWSLTVVHEGALDVSDVGDQRLLLLSPDGEAFHVMNLKDERELTVAHWRADSKLVWLETSFGFDTWQSIALDLQTGDRVNSWGEDGQAPGLGYLGTLPDGDDLWGLISIRGGTADLLRVSADASVDHATGYDIFKASEAWTDSEAGWSVFAVGIAEDNSNALPVAGLSWYRLDHNTWGITPMSAPQYGSTTTIARCGNGAMTGGRVPVKPSLSSADSECMWLDLADASAPIPVGLDDVFAEFHISSTTLSGMGIGLGEGTTYVTMILDGDVE